MPTLREECLIDRILEPGALTAVFQPVCEGRDGALRTHYLEALIRGPRGTSVESPNVLFEYARRKNRAAEVDRACVRAVLGAAEGLPAHVHIGLNIHAATLALDPEFLNVLGDAATESGIAPERLVVEIVEHAPPWDVTGFRNGVEGLRAIGVRVALDDIGLGHSNYMMILECRPDYFKIDRYFVHDASQDYYRKAVLASVAQLARPFGARVVAEGVETAADLRTAREAGISLFQGWLLSGAHPAQTFGGTDVIYSE